MRRMGLPDRSMSLWLLDPLIVELRTHGQKVVTQITDARQDVGGSRSDGVPVQVQPVAGHIQGHAELEQEGVGGVQQREVDQQTHGGAAVRQHVQHGSEFGG